MKVEQSREEQNDLLNFRFPCLLLAEPQLPRNSPIFRPNSLMQVVGPPRQAIRATLPRSSNRCLFVFKLQYGFPNLELVSRGSLQLDISNLWHMSGGILGGQAPVDTQTSLQVRVLCHGVCAQMHWHTDAQTHSRAAGGRCGRKQRTPRNQSQGRSRIKLNLRIPG